MFFLISLCSQIESYYCNGVRLPSSSPSASVSSSPSSSVSFSPSLSPSPSPFHPIEMCIPYQNQTINGSKVGMCDIPPGITKLDFLLCGGGGGGSGNVGSFGNGGAGGGGGCFLVRNLTLPIDAVTLGYDLGGGGIGGTSTNTSGEPGHDSVLILSSDPFYIFIAYGGGGGSENQGGGYAYGGGGGGTNGKGQNGEYGGEGGNSGENAQGLSLMGGCGSPLECEVNGVCAASITNNYSIEYCSGPGGGYVFEATPTQGGGVNEFSGGLPSSYQNEYLGGGASSAVIDGPDAIYYFDYAPSGSYGAGGSAGTTLGGNGGNGFLQFLLY